MPISTPATRIRLKKKRRVRPSRGPKTFCDLHAPQRDGEMSRGLDAGGSGFPRAADAIAGPAPQGGGDDHVLNHVLV